MADITLAEYEGAVWLVGGEAHIDDLLANTLPDGVTIEFLACAHKAEVHALWIQHCGEQQFVGDPWIIHPAIVRRIRRAAPDYAVFFAQWSVQLDADARRVIHAAAQLACVTPELPVQLTDYLEPGAQPAMEGLSSVRMQLIEDELGKAGVARARIVRVRRDVAELQAVGQESQRVDIVVRA